jgi:hypothetical protein
MDAVQTSLAQNASQLNDITKDLNNYKSYALNVGQSNEDWGPAIQQAVNDVNTVGGGKVLIPNGIKVATPVNLPSGVTVEGLHYQYNPSGARIITLTGNNNWLFFIGNNVRDVVIRNLRIATSGTGNIAIKCEGTYPNSSFEHVFEKLFFTGFDKCISISNASGSTGEWQCDNILINHCIFAEGTGNQMGIYLNTQNADYIKINNCKIFTKYGIWSDKSGFMTVDTCAGGYTDQTVGNFITLNSDLNGNLVVVNSQAENILNFLKTTSIGSYNNPITFIGCEMNQCQFGDNRILNSIGCTYHVDFVYDAGATDVRIYSQGDSGTSHFKPTNNVIAQIRDTSRTNPYMVTKLNSLPYNTKGIMFPTAYTSIDGFQIYPSGLYKISASIEVLIASTVELKLAYYDENGTSQTLTILPATALGVGLTLVNTVVVNCRASAGTGYITLNGDTGGTANAAKLNAVFEYLG